MPPRLGPAAITVFLFAALAMGGCASTSGPVNPDPAATSPVGTGSAGNGGPTDPNAPAPVGAGVPDPAQSGRITVGQRAASAVEGLVMGAVIGSQAGPIGAAVGAGAMLIYSAITGQVPFQGGGGGRSGRPGRVENDREAALEAELERELARGDVLEDEIAAELARQEELLREMENDSEEFATEAEPLSDESLVARAEVRVAPEAPVDRNLPIAIFDEETTTIARGTWGNSRDMVVVKRSLDADRDGKPEQVRYFDETSGVMIRKEEDRDYDGAVDAWSTYENGRLVARKLDTDNDGKADAWEEYRSGRMTSRTIDRDSDGIKDAFYRYEDGSLVEERHDANNDGKIDLVVRYEKRQRSQAEEDRDRDGRMDSWTTYRVVDGEELVARVERDTKKTGKPNIFETFTAVDGKAILSKREEDVNGDGSIDVTSIYKNGKLVRREIADPALVPL